MQKRRPTASGAKRPKTAYSNCPSVGAQQLERRVLNKNYLQFSSATGMVASGRGVNKLSEVVSRLEVRLSGSKRGVLPPKARRFTN
jgi:hypothetical protein